MRRECIQDHEAGLAEEFTEGVNQDGFIVDEQNSSVFGRAEAV